jgi:hypothetical protein
MIGRTDSPLNAHNMQPLVFLVRSTTGVFRCQRSDLNRWADVIDPGPGFVAPDATLESHKWMSINDEELSEDGAQKDCRPLSPARSSCWAPGS